MTIGFSNQIPLRQVDALGGCWKFEAERRWPVANTSIQHFIHIRSEQEPG